jgi:hypothetical protein
MKTNLLEGIDARRLFCYTEILQNHDKNPFERKQIGDKYSLSQLQ